MKTANTIICVRPRTTVRFATFFAIFAAVTAATRGDPPTDPLPAPLFSFDLDSPSVLDGSLQADAMLTPVLPDAETVFMGWMLGLGLSADELDAQSVANADVSPDAPFALLFSVDEATIAAAAPDPRLVSLGVPYNALDQAIRGQVAGDEFMSTALFLLDGIIGEISALVLLNNVLVRNNFDEGGTDFVASPPSSALDYIENEPQDCVDSMAVVPSATSTIYFSVSSGSPSLSGLHGRPSPSGADIFVFTPPEERSAAKRRVYGVRGAPAGPASDPPCQADCCALAGEEYDDCIDQGGTVEVCAEQAHVVLRTCLQNVCGITPPAPPGLYVSSLDLGLLQCDDIDGLIVFDTNADGVFNGTDRVLFSLVPDSPSLATIPGASASGAAADIFVVSYGDPEPTLFASAANLGLGEASDNIDALDYTLCDDAEVCATAHGIRSNDSVPTLSAWGVAAMALLMLIVGTVVVAQRRSSTARP